MRELYVRTLQQYNRQPNDEEFRAWMEVLSSNSYSDVDAALRRWSGNTALDMHSGRPAGARMPSPAELKVSIQSFDRSQSDRFVSCGNCDNGWVRITYGKTVNGSQVNERRPAVKRCECWLRWALYKKGVETSGKPQLVGKE